MKKYFLLFIVVVFTMATTLCGCSGDASKESELKDTLNSTYEEMNSTFSGASGQYSLVAEYLKSWANKNDIDVEKNADNYMVMVNPATSGCDDRETTVLQCPVKTGDFNNSMQTLATALTALLGPESHGKITLIVTEIDNGKFTGADSIDKKYLKCDNFINMEQNDDILLYLSGCYETVSTMTAPTKPASPSYSDAFVITMSTSGFSDPFDFDNHYPNPIEVIGGLLATEKSSGQLFQLASFECETVSGYTPTTATAVVVVDGNDVDSFTKRFEKSYSSMKSRFAKLEDNFVYTITETDMPETVMSNQVSDNIISLMYTLKTGIYLQDEDTGEIVSASDISNVTTKNGKFKLTLTARGTNKESLDEMSTAYLTTSGLCDIDYSVSDPRITWISDYKGDPARFLKDALGSEEHIAPKTLESSECDVFSKNGWINMVSYQFNINHSESALLNLLHFMEGLTQ